MIERAWAGKGQREMETENLKQSTCHQSKAQHGARTQEPWDSDLSWSQMFNWLSHPGALRVRFSVVFCSSVPGPFLGVMCHNVEKLSKLEIYWGHVQVTRRWSRRTLRHFPAIVHIYQDHKHWRSSPSWTHPFYKGWTANKYKMKHNMIIPNCMMILGFQNPRYEDSQLKIFLGTYSNLREKSSPCGGKPGVMYASWNSPL